MFSVQNSLGNGLENSKFANLQILHCEPVPKEAYWNADAHKVASTLGFCVIRAEISVLLYIGTGDRVPERGRKQQFPPLEFCGIGRAIPEPEPVYRYPNGSTDTQPCELHKMSGINT